VTIDPDVCAAMDLPAHTFVRLSDATDGAQAWCAIAHNFDMAWQAALVASTLLVMALIFGIVRSR